MGGRRGMVRVRQHAAGHGAGLVVHLESRQSEVLPLGQQVREGLAVETRRAQGSRVAMPIRVLECREGSMFC